MADGLYLTRAQADEMLAHLRAKLPEEACGMAAGRSGRVERVIPVTNELHSPVRFYMQPQELYDALMWIEENGKELVAIFHSHPNGPAVPSPTDIAEFYYPGAVTLIWSPVSGAWEPRAFLIEYQQAREIPIFYVNE